MITPSLPSVDTGQAPDAPSLDDVHAIVEEVWTTFLGEAEPILPAFDENVFDSEGWTAAITVTGEWEAMVLVTLTDSVARTMTGAMLMMSPEEVAAHLSTEDLTDALGELVNVIGGNVKSVMAGPSKLSLPLVAQGAVTTTSYLSEACRADLQWQGQPVRVSIAVPRPEVAA